MIWNQNMGQIFDGPLLAWWKAGYGKSMLKEWKENFAWPHVLSKLDEMQILCKYYANIWSHSLLHKEESDEWDAWLIFYYLLSSFCGIRTKSIDLTS